MELMSDRLSNAKLWVTLSVENSNQLGLRQFSSPIRLRNRHNRYDRRGWGARSYPPVCVGTRSSRNDVQTEGTRVPRNARIPNWLLRQSAFEPEFSENFP